MYGLQVFRLYLFLFRSDTLLFNTSKQLYKYLDIRIKDILLTINIFYFNSTYFSFNNNVIPHLSLTITYAPCVTLCVRIDVSEANPRVGPDKNAGSSVCTAGRMDPAPHRDFSFHSVKHFFPGIS